MPCFMEKTEDLCNTLKKYSYNDFKKLLACNDEIAKLNYSRYKDMNLYKKYIWLQKLQKKSNIYFTLRNIIIDL